MKYDKILVSKDSGGKVVDIDTVKGEVKIAHATYTTPDRDSDRTMPGVFKKSWQEFKDTRLFLNHDKTQAPGVVKGLEEDKNHGYTIAKMGDWTLGQDVLKMMMAGAVTDASYTGVMTKWQNNNSGGKDFYEGLHKETSVLTHWGSHPDSKVVAVKELSDTVIKQLTDSEITFLRQIISNNDVLIENLSTFAAQLPESSDLYIWANDMLADQSRSLSYLKSKLIYNMPPEMRGLAMMQKQLQDMRAFCKNSDASDPMIAVITKQADELETSIKSIAKEVGTTAAEKALQQSRSDAGNRNAFQHELYLLKIKMSLS